MNIKKRLIVSNLIAVIIPFIITIVAAFIFIFFSSRIFNKDVGYHNFIKVAAMQGELVKAASSIASENGEAIEEVEFPKYVEQKLSSLGGKFIIIKGKKIIAASKDMNKIDIEKCMDEDMKQSLDKTVNVNDKLYSIQSTEITMKDGNKGHVILLAPVGEQKGLLINFIIGVIAVFIVSFISVNIIMSYLFSKTILKPITLLKKATCEISNGNLDCEIIDEGDEEIKELCHDFEAMRIQLKDSISMKMKYDDNRKMLISSISHDLKTPITSIRGYVEGILDGVANTDEKRESYLKTIYSKTEHMDSMIDDLLLYSRLDLNQIPFNFEKTDIVDYFDYCINESALELAKANIEISLKNDLKNSRFVMIDRDRMRRVILNIIDNSRKYMGKSQGEITVWLRETNSSIIIELRDNGAGISNDEINKIFDRFYRGDSSRSGAKGTGLGLAIAKQIVEGHEGRIWATSHGDDGTSIMISLGKLAENRGVL